MLPLFFMPFSLCSFSVFWRLDWKRVKKRWLTRTRFRKKRLIGKKVKSKDFFLLEQFKGDHKLLSFSKGKGNEGKRPERWFLVGVWNLFFVYFFCFLFFLQSWSKENGSHAETSFETIDNYQEHMCTFVLSKWKTFHLWVSYLQPRDFISFTS